LLQLHHRHDPRPRAYEGLSSELELMMWRRSRFATAFVETGEATWMLTT
jgi:hypothetical protein